jgi:hypothetical protein
MTALDIIAVEGLAVALLTLLGVALERWHILRWLDPALGLLLAVALGVAGKQRLAEVVGNWCRANGIAGPDEEGYAGGEAAI